MNKRFIINESEKDSILKLHQEEKSKGNIFEQLEEGDLFDKAMHWLGWD